ncbi:MAG: lysyl endopeptidase, partial [Planctomycetota bacterium]
MHRYSPAALLAALFVSPALAQTTQPVGQIHPNAQAISNVAGHGVPILDRNALSIDDTNRAANGQPARYAVPHAVNISPLTHGTWEQLDDNWSLWRLRIKAPGAEHVNLGFQTFFMPAGARMQLYSTDYRYVVRPFDSVDHQPTGEFWTPVVMGEEIVCEVYVRTALKPQVLLNMTHIGSGYRFFGAGATALSNNDGSGSCNVDVNCPQGAGWAGEISASAAISTGGSLFCSGSMINNTAQDGRNFFLTAYHCGIGSSQAGSLVCYWNYDAVTCGSNSAPLNQFSIGSVLRAGWSTSDFTLVELNSTPNAAWGVTYAGWNRGTGNASSAVAVHHPSGDSKKISFENQATQTTAYGSSSQNSNANHVRVVDWDVGTTEGGSSGSPLFDQNHRIIGQLHGGGAACGNNSSDWYGRLLTSWTGAGSNSNRLSNWLDPLGTGQLTLDTSGSGTLATSTAIGSGCGGTAIVCDEAFYETPNFDLGNSSFTLDFDGTSYTLVSGQGSWIAPSGGVLGLADDQEIAQSIPFSLPHPGGSTSTLHVCSNGFISAASNGAAWDPSSADF